MLTGIYHQRMNQILANPFSNRSGRPLTQYLNPAAFAAPDPAGQGNVGRNSIMGPGNWGLDMGLARTFQVKESQKVEFRVEAYNFTNSFRPGCPSGTTGAGGSCPVGGVNAQFNSNVFGQIRNSLDPRIMQFALKYVF